MCLVCGEHALYEARRFCVSALRYFLFYVLNGLSALCGLDALDVGTILGCAVNALALQVEELAA